LIRKWVHTAKIRFFPANREISDYFSGTGNSLAVARDLAGRLSAELVPISSVVDRGGIDIDADAVGIVFPEFYATNDSGIPLIVKRFAEKLLASGGMYFLRSARSEISRDRRSGTWTGSCEPGAGRS